jgi:cell division protein FtsN
MSDGRRLRFLLLAVGGTSLALLLALRWVGRLATSDIAAARITQPGTATAHAGAAEGTPDLTFYKTLGASPAPGRRAASAPTEPTLRPAPGDAIVSGSAYVVQALATRDEGQARRLRDRLASHGLPATLQEDDSGGTPIFRVRVGRWKERAPAESVANRLREKEGLEPWVLQESSP